ncbi:hypothetical protein [Thermococcus pacificus]|uniref:Uncharacterized protein n=1 Tax=Thermococcus pacificus TaxID=71998 RepID=A0A218P5S5_9EURY|nr:hypothetical protein [Thermococcus pacificus]ASJ06156.1 hypothetical protein A3L08_01835 [Thermococcus pacificus]
MDPGAVIFLLFIAAIVGMILMGIKGEESSRERCRRFSESVAVEGTFLKLPIETKLSKGKFVLRGEWRGSKNRYYHIERSFEALEELSAGEIELTPEPFSVEVKKNDDALVELLAYIVEEGEFKNAVIVPIIPSYSVEIEKDTLEASKDMEFAHLRVEVIESGLYGKLYVNVSKCRGARVEFEKNGIHTREKLVEVKESGEAEFRREFWTKPLILIMDRNHADPRKLRDVFGKQEILEGHGEYLIRLTLDVPFSKDEHDTSRVTVSPGGEVPAELKEPEVKVVI